MVLWILVVCLVIISGVLITLLKTGKLKEMLSLSKLKLDGIILIKALKIGEYNCSSESSFKEQFEAALSTFYSKYDFLQQETDYEEGSISIKVKSHERVLVKDTAVIRELVNDLNGLFELLPKNRYMIRVRLSGELTSFFNRSRITISNNNSQVGFNEQKTERRVFRYVKSDTEKQ